MSDWKKWFSKGKQRRPSSSDTQYERALRAVETRPPKGDAFRGASASTGFFIAEAVKEKRFRTAAIALADKGRERHAESVADRAMNEGKYLQAWQIYEHLGNRRKAALAAEKAARDMMGKGAGPRLTAARLYAAVQAYGRLLRDRTEDRVAVLKKLLGLCNDLVTQLELAGDMLAATDTDIYAVQLLKYLLPFSKDGASFSKDPAFFASIEEEIPARLERVEERLRRYASEKDIPPGSPEGARIVARLKKLRKLRKELGMAGT